MFSLCPPFVGEVPYPADGGTPSQVWMGGGGTPSSWWGYPGMGYPISCRGYPPAGGKPWQGYPSPPSRGTLLPLSGVPTPLNQSSISCTCYVAGGMPLVFTQEDFLVRILVILKNIHRWTFTDTENKKYKNSKSFIFMHLGNPDCNIFIWNSFMTPITNWP